MVDATHLDMDSAPQRRYRVSLCITELDPGGAERQFVRLATGLNPSRFKVDVICLSGPGALAEQLREQGIPVTCLHATGPRDARIIYRLWRQLRQTRPDLVQTFLFHANIAGRVAARLAGVPIVVSGIRVAERRKSWHLKLDRLTEKLVDCHVCVSQDVARFSCDVAGLTSNKIAVIPNEIDASTFVTAAPADLAEFGFPHDTDVILFVGRLDEQKNPELAIDSFEILAAEHPSARLLIVGEGPLENKIRARASLLNGRVAVAGYRNDVPNLMKAVRCLILPSRWEGMPNVALEAVAAGLPVVATAAEGVVEAIESGHGCMIVRDATPVAFAHAIETVVYRRRTGIPSQSTTQAIINTRVMKESAPQAYARLYECLLNPRKEGLKNLLNSGTSRSHQKKVQNLQSQTL